MSVITTTSLSQKKNEKKPRRTCSHGTGFVIEKVVILFMVEFDWLKIFELSQISDEPCLVLFQSKAL